MAPMETIAFSIKDKDKAAQLPAGWAIISFTGDGLTQWCGFTANPAHRFAAMRQRTGDDRNVSALFSATDTVSVRYCATAIDALKRYRAIIHDHNPPYQQQIRHTSGYAYLALDARRFPYISIQDHTNDDWIYAGPFRSRFFLMDVLDSICKIMQLPSCETDEWPCEKLDNGQCRGYCRAMDETASLPEINAEKLNALLKEAFLRPDNGISAMLKHERDRYFDDLEFEKADLFNQEIERLDKYSDWLRFLFTGKLLTWDDADFSVRNGLLSRCVVDGKEYHFAVSSTEYRDNETLAMNLDTVDEAKVIYDYYKTNRGKKHV